jgi:SAM-dependent methyltransferase
MMIHYHTYYLDQNKRSIDQWDFNVNNLIKLIGDYDHNLIASDLVKILNSYTNKTVVDVGCRDGFYSFVFEKLGNKVCSVDIDNTKARQYVHNFLNSTTTFIHDNIYNIINWSDIKFDIVFVGDLLVHLENPLGAMRILHTICKERLLIMTDFYNESDDYTDINNHFHYNTDIIGNGRIGLGHINLPWLFSKTAFNTMLRMSGFDEIKILNEFKLQSVNCKSIPDQKPFVRNIMLVEAIPCKTNMHDHNIQGFKINPFFTSLYPKFVC